MMKNHPSTAGYVRWLAPFLCLMISLSAFVTLGLIFTQHRPNEGSIKLAGQAADVLTPLLFSFLAALIISRVPRNPIGWLLMLPAVMAAVSGPINRYFHGLTTVPPAPTFLNLVLAWFVNIAWLGLIFPVLLIPLLFPTGRPPSRRWRWVIFLIVGMCAFFILVTTFLAELKLENVIWSIPNPVGFLPGTTWNYLMAPWGLMLVISTILSLASLVVRYRRAAQVEREQIKWLLYATGLFAVIYLSFIYLSAKGGSFGNLSGLDVILFNLALLTFPASIAIAILRYRLWDIDVIIRKTLVWSMLTVLLGLVYFGGVTFLQAVFSAVSRQRSAVTVVLSTLLIAALFNPLRRRIQEAVDRRFYRRKYDAEQALASFAALAREEVDLEELSARLLVVVEETVQPESVSIWLRQGTRGKS